MFIGCPINLSRKIGIPLEDYLKKNKIPTLFIQNSGDPAFLFDDLKDLEKGSDSSYFEFEADNHKYKDFEKIGQLVKDYLY